MSNFQLRETERIFKTELMNNTELKFVLKKKRKDIIETVDKSQQDVESVLKCPDFVPSTEVGEVFLLQGNTL